METQHFIRVAHGTDTRIRVLINDLPVYQRGPTDYTVTHTDGANHLVVPGENLLTLELLDGPTNYHVIVDVTVDNDHERPLARIEWPTIVGDAPRVLPFTVTVPFHVDGVSYLPAYLRAPRARFGPEGTHELRQAVRDFHDAVSRNDAEAFVRQVSLKSKELLAAYEGHGSFTEAAAREGIGEYFSERPVARPLDFDALVFESRAEGRVAYVTRADLGPAIEAETPDGRRFATNLWLTRHEDAWKIFR